MLITNCVAAHSAVTVWGGLPKKLDVCTMYGVFISRMSAMARTEQKYCCVGKCSAFLVVMLRSWDDVERKITLQ